MCCEFVVDFSCDFVGETLLKFRVDETVSDFRYILFYVKFCGRV